MRRRRPQTHTPPHPALQGTAPPPAKHSYDLHGGAGCQNRKAPPAWLRRKRPPPRALPPNDPKNHDWHNETVRHVFVDRPLFEHAAKRRPIADHKGRGGQYNIGLSCSRHVAQLRWLSGPRSRRSPGGTIAQNDVPAFSSFGTTRVSVLAACKPW